MRRVFLVLMVEKMKRYDDIFDCIVSFENLYEAFLEARKGRRYKREIMRTGDKVEAVIADLTFDLLTGEWRPQPYHNFECRSEVKRRMINAPTFRDRIVHHAIYRNVAGLFERKFIFDSYACRKGKGTHKAVERLQDFMRRAAGNGGRVYVLQCDVSKYYPSIDHEILKREIRRTIADRRLLEVWDHLIDDFEPGNGKGIPIGAVTSQLSANIYLNPLDHLIKEDLRVKYYLRYMDDFILVSVDKDRLKQCLAAIREFLGKRLRLTLNPKTKIFPASHGVDFAGYRTFTNYRLPRKRNIKAAKIRFKDLSHRYKHGQATAEEARQVKASFLGYVKHCNAAKTTESTLKYLVLRKENKENGEKGDH